MATLEIHSGGLGEIATRLEFMADELTDMTPFFEALIEDWADSRLEMFRTQGFGQWPGYLPSEEQWLAIKGRLLGRRVTDADLLKIDKGATALRLFKSLTDSSHGDFIGIASPDGVKLGSAVPYVETHRNDGNQAPQWMGGHTIPKRDPFILGTFEDAMGEAVRDYVDALEVIVTRGTTADVYAALGL